MNHTMLSYILVFFSIISGISQAEKKVLFIGNSYTSANNLPLMVEQMAISTGDALIYDSYTPGGARFLNHASNATTLSKINSKNWDYVVLQAQSQETSFSQAQMETELFPYAEALSNTIRANNECSQPLFYMTWGRENGEANNCQWLPWVCTYEGMDDAIRETYLSMAEENDAEVSPVGAVWRYLRINNPEINLYSSDGSHPSLAGSYAAATAFYAMIYKKDPSFIVWNSSISEAVATTIKAAAKIIVFDAISTWDFTINPAIADFSSVIADGEVIFTNTSADFDEILWDFGDGQISTELNPVHSYTTNGDYIVSLTITKCGKTDTKIEVLTISSLSTLEFVLETVRVFPNPTSNSITVEMSKTYNETSVQIIDMLGKVIVEKTERNKSSIIMDFSTLSEGMYIIQVIAGNRTYTTKVSKI